MASLPAWIMWELHHRHRKYQGTKIIVNLRQGLWRRPIRGVHMHLIHNQIMQERMKLGILSERFFGMQLNINWIILIIKSRSRNYIRPVLHITKQKVTYSLMVNPSHGAGGHYLKIHLADVASIWPLVGPFCEYLFVSHACSFKSVKDQWVFLPVLWV